MDCYVTVKSNGGLISAKGNGVTGYFHQRFVTVESNGGLISAKDNGVTARGGQEKGWDSRPRLQIHQPFSRRQGGGLDPFRAVGIDNFPNYSCFYVFLRISCFNLFCAAGQPPWDRHLGVLCFMKDFGCRFAHTVCSEIDVGAR